MTHPSDWPASFTDKSRRQSVLGWLWHRGLLLSLLMLGALVGYWVGTVAP